MFILSYFFQLSIFSHRFMSTAEQMGRWVSNKIDYFLLKSDSLTKL